MRLEASAFENDVSDWGDREDPLMWECMKEGDGGSKSAAPPKIPVFISEGIGDSYDRNSQFVIYVGIQETYVKYIFQINCRHRL